MISISGTRVIGGSVILACTVSGLNSLASGTTIQFTGPRETTGNGATSLQLILSPAEFSDVGVYTCMATVSSFLLNNDITSNTATEDVILQSKCSYNISSSGGVGGPSNRR